MAGTAPPAAGPAAGLLRPLTPADARPAALRLPAVASEPPVGPAAGDPARRGTVH